jgi:hypothetical protein
VSASSRNRAVWFLTTTWQNLTTLERCLQVPIPKQTLNHQLRHAGSGLDREGVGRRCQQHLQVSNSRGFIVQEQGDGSNVPRSEPYMILRRLAAAAVLTAMIPFSSGHAQWSPTGPLTNVPLVPNCQQTGGDIAVAGPGVIFWCPLKAQQINSTVPDAGHFYFVHEYGHIALGTSSEPSADC